MTCIQLFQIGLLAISILFSGLVLVDQKKSSIRNSVAQLDDRNLSAANLKLRAIVHKINFLKRETIISLRLGEYTATAGISDPGTIQNLTVDAQSEVETIDGVIETNLRTIRAETGYPDTQTAEEEHVELLITCNTVDQGKVRRISDLALSKIKAGERAS